MGISKRDRRRRSTRRNFKRRRPPRSRSSSDATTTADTFLSTLSSWVSLSASSSSPPSSPLSRSSPSPRSSSTSSASTSATDSPLLSSLSTETTDSILLLDTDDDSNSSSSERDDSSSSGKGEDADNDSESGDGWRRCVDGRGFTRAGRHRRRRDSAALGRARSTPSATAVAQQQNFCAPPAVSNVVPFDPVAAPIAATEIASQRAGVTDVPAVGHNQTVTSIPWQLAPLALALLPPLLLSGPRPAFTILRESAPAAAREYASLPLVRPWRELARAVDPTGRFALTDQTIWAGDAQPTLALPIHFDGRRRWGRLLTPPSDQGLSGACWAFAAVSALGDRAAIWTWGAVRPWPDRVLRPGVFGTLSARDIIDRDFDALTDAQTEAEADIVSANEIHHGSRHADYGHTLVGAFEALYIGGAGCAGGWRCRPLAYYALASTTEADIKAEIFAWGPVASAFALHEDFMYPERYPRSWPVGVYRHDPAACPRSFGGHAVVVVGWRQAWLPSRSGTERDASKQHTCWIVRHAWGAGWAPPRTAHPDGYFFMASGQCGVEANAVACVPDIHGLALDHRDAHRVAPPLSDARRRRTTIHYPPSADLIGPDRIDSALLPDMGTFVAAEVYGPWEPSGDRPQPVVSDAAAYYADNSRPASDAWTTALRRSWALAGLRSLSLSELPTCEPAAQTTTAPRGREVPLWPAGPDLWRDNLPAVDAIDPLAAQDTDRSLGLLGATADQRFLPDDQRVGQGGWLFGGGGGDRGRDYDFAASENIDNVEVAIDHDDGDGDDGGIYSNSDAELSDDERYADAEHRLANLPQMRRESLPL